MENFKECFKNLILSLAAGQLDSASYLPSFPFNIHIPRILHLEFSFPLPLQCFISLSLLLISSEKNADSKVLSDD